MHYVLIFSFFFISLVSFSQTTATVDSLNNRHQKCLDKGKCMMCCSQQFYYQLDTILNVVYNELKKSCDNTEKKNLINEELKWLSNRDVYFKSLSHSSDNVFDENSEDGRMIRYQSQAQFIEKRIRELLCKKHTDYSSIKSDKVSNK